MKLKLIWIFICLVLVSGCRKDKYSHNFNNFDSIFEGFWINMNSNYAFWDIDKSNWDSLYHVYKPLFHQLDLNNQNDVRRSVSYFRRLTARLIDSHYTITFDNKVIKDSIIFPAYARKMIYNKIHGKFDFSYLDTKYFDKDYLTGNYYYTENSIPKVLFTRFATINNQILYFNCNQFALLRALRANDSSTKLIMNSLDLYLSSMPKRIKGLIFDLRGNGGGDVEDLSYLFGKLIDKPVDIGYIKYKNGNGRLDYTPWVKATLYPSKNFKEFNLPIIVLVDTYSASLSELFSMSVRVLPNGKLIGEKTWGATAPLSDNLIYNYGSFNIEGFLNVSMASGQFKNIDNRNYEGVGYEPDIKVPFDLVSYQLGRDNQLEVAIESILR